MRQSRITLAFIVFAGLSSAAWGQNPPAQQPPAQQATPPPANAASATQQSAQGEQSQQAQQPVSLADAARKYREEKAAKEKNGAPQGTLYTNEGVIPKSGTNVLGMAPVPRPNQSTGNAAGRGGAGKAPATGFEGTIASLDEAYAQITSLEKLDRATLVNAVLIDNNADFPGRAEWEARLMAGRDFYVSHGKDLNRGMKDLLLQAKALKDGDPEIKDDDPRVQSLMSMVTQVTAEAKKTGDDFQRLMDEGRARARQAKAPGE
jgi:hypothetical protein